MSEHGEVRPIDIYTEAGGSTTEVALTLTINGQTGKTKYIVPQGYKLKVYDIELTAEGETRVLVRVGATGVYATETIRRKYKLASAGHIHVPEGMPFIIEAYDADQNIFLGYIQTSGASMSAQLNAEISKLVGW